MQSHIGDSSGAGAGGRAGAGVGALRAGPGWATVKVERGPWLGSDHYPLIVTLAPVAQRAPKSAARP